MKPKTHVSAHIFIHGHVQGVSFRANLWREAKKHGITGWVRNLKDGRMEAVLQGEEDKVEEVIKWCRRGPPAAKVEKVEVAYEEGPENHTRFDIR